MNRSALPMANTALPALCGTMSRCPAGSLLRWPLPRWLEKSTTYTVLKKLCERGVLQNSDGQVTSLIRREDVQQAESAAVVDKTFGGSLPRFVAAFLNSKPISEAEAAEIRALLDAAQQKGRGSYAQYRAFLFAAQRTRRGGRSGSLVRLPGAAPRPRPQPSAVLAVAGRRGTVRAAVGHSAAAAPPAKRPAGCRRRHRAGAGCAAASGFGTGSTRRCGRAAVVHRLTPGIYLWQSGWPVCCAGAAQHRGLLAATPQRCAGLQGTGRLLRRGLCGCTVHAGHSAPPHLSAGQSAGRGPAGRAAA